jgi:hypothetical protein
MNAHTGQVPGVPPYGRAFVPPCNSRSVFELRMRSRTPSSSWRVTSPGESVAISPRRNAPVQPMTVMA